MGNGWRAIALIAQAIAGWGALILLSSPAGGLIEQSTPAPHQKFPGSSDSPDHGSKAIDRDRCPAALETLMPLLLRDLPSYANRVIVRSRNRSRTIDLPPSYVLLAGAPDYRPLSPSLEDLGLAEYEAIAPADQPQQVFFTTLERQYGYGGYARLEGFYWLFLTQQAGQWQLAGVVSSLGDLSTGQPASPPRDSSEGVVAQAIRLWLRDCHAGSIQLVPVLPES
ncbi:MAG: hypothetical protein Fur0046_06950 [Cyanobacteria bacterium J069]|nr:MAG: hypothetical protein D6742_04860 [Cyanobacteria bacterium J069]